MQTNLTTTMHATQVSFDHLSATDIADKIEEIEHFPVVKKAVTKAVLSLGLYAPEELWSTFKPDELVTRCLVRIAFDPSALPVREKLATALVQYFPLNLVSSFDRQRCIECGLKIYDEHFSQSSEPSSRMRPSLGGLLTKLRTRFEPIDDTTTKSEGSDLK